MKKTLFAVAILLGLSCAASAQDARASRPKKATKTQTITTQTTTVQKAQKSSVLAAETISDEQIRMDKIKAKTVAENAKKSKAASDIKN